MDNLTLWTALVAGLLSFFSPCILPLFAVYISLITGLSVAELQEKDVKRGYLLLKIFYFVLGFSLVFICLGAFAKYLFVIVFFNKHLLNIASGIIIIFFGLVLLDFIKIKFLISEKKIHTKEAGSFILGVVFAAGWTPCIGPILASILAMASNEATVYKSIKFLAVYSLGLSIPFFILGFFANFFISKITYINKYLGTIQKLMGIFLLILGVLIIYGKIL